MSYIIFSQIISNLGLNSTVWPFFRLPPKMSFDIKRKGCSEQYQGVPPWELVGKIATCFLDLYVVLTIFHCVSQTHFIHLSSGMLGQWRASQEWRKTGRSLAISPPSHCLRQLLHRDTFPEKLMKLRLQGLSLAQASSSFLCAYS